MTKSPAQRYAEARLRNAHLASAAGRYALSLPFSLDDFQLEANAALESNHSVIVAAPTGAGKTVIADFAIFLARERHVKAFYTTPIKALSNQKYHDLVDQYGPDAVGLLTGDTSVNSQADIVVMTTEVLRNMLYEHSPTLDSLRYVILDEIHFLADRFRGPVWEEVIIHLPETVKIIGLSATVSNVEDFSDWIASVRGDTKLVVSERRPVPLEQHVLLQADEHTEPELLNLYVHDDEGEQTSKLDVHLMRRFDELDHRAERRMRGRSDHGRGRGANSDGQSKGGHSVERYTPRRWAVVDELQYLDMLPGIYFIFSRKGCDQAIEQCINAGLELTSPEEAAHIRQIVDDMVDGQCSAEDLKALQFAQFRFALEEGFAPHHAGMITLFRQIVERLFEEGLVKMVFATETLALGINMPARCVVVEKLQKFDGTGHVPLTPGEYTQLTGRAGRRGIDTIGHAIVVDHKGFVPQTAAALSSKRVYPLHSSFTPTFNMAVNLLYSSNYATSRRTLDHSFAQWEANGSAWELESQITTLKEALRGYEKAFSCEYGDFRQLLLTRIELSSLQKDGRKHLKHQSFRSDADRSKAWHSLDQRIATLKRQDREHPCQHCPDIARHLTWGHRWMREYRELQRVQDRYDSRTGSVARQFDRICDILRSLGYLERSGDGNTLDFQLTDRGHLLRQLYSEHDLMLAQAICDEVFDGLRPEYLAGVLSSLVFRARRGSSEAVWYPGGKDGPAAQAARQLTNESIKLNALREDAGLSIPDDLDFGLADTIVGWARGSGLGLILENKDMTGGDFVRTTKRLADLLQQVGNAAAGYASDLGESTHAAAAQRLSNRAFQAQNMIKRDIVAYSGVD